MTFPQLTACTLLLLLARTCIPLESVVFTSDGLALPHINLLGCTLHNNPLWLCCALQCYAGCLIGTLTGATVAHVHAQAGTLDSHDRLLRNCQMLPCDVMLCCEDYECGCCTIFPSMIFNSCLCPFLLTAASVDYCTYSAIASLRDRCTRPSDEVDIEPLEERLLLGYRIMH